MTNSTGIHSCGVREHAGIEKVISKLNMHEPIMPDPDLGQDVAFLAHVITSLQKRLLSIHDHMSSDLDYNEIYKEFWAPLLENPDGTLNLDAVKRELHDYHYLMGAASRVYGHVTGGMVSKTNTLPSAVISVHDDHVQELVDQAIEDFVKDHGLCQKCEGAGECWEPAVSGPRTSIICPDCKGTRGAPT